MARVTATPESLGERLVALARVPVRNAGGGEVAATALCVAAGFLSAAVLPAALAIAALPLGLRRLARRSLAPGTGADWPIAMLLVMLPVTLWVSPSTGMTGVRVARLLLCVVLYYAMVNYATTTSRWRTCLLGLLFFGLLLAVTAPFTVQWKERFLQQAFSSHTPTTLTGINHDVMAAALVMLLPLGVAVLLTPRAGNRPSRVALTSLSAVAVGCMLVALILTESVGAYVAALVSVAAVLTLRRPRVAAMLGVGSLVALGLVALAGGTGVFARFLVNEINGDLLGRVPTWASAFHLLQSFPFTGVGLGGFAQAANALYPVGLADPGAHASQAYNAWLQAGAEAGLPGLAAWLLLQLTAFRGAWRLERVARLQSQEWLGTMAAGLLGTQVAQMVHGVVDASTWASWPSAIVWALWALVVAAPRLGRQPHQMGQRVLQDYDHHTGSGK